jgi:hypothetical protein
VRGDEARLAEPFETSGSWWNPALPDEAVPGRLRYFPREGISLELDGRLRGSKYRDHRTWPIICGETRTGQACTLLRASERSSSSGPRSETSKIDVQYSLVGCIIDKLESLQFSSARVDYSNLTAWMGRRPFTWPSPPLNGDRTYCVSYDPPKDVRVSLGDLGFTQTIGCWFTGGSESFQEVDLRFGDSVVFRPLRRQSFSWFLTRMHEFRNLLSLLMVEPTKYERVDLQFGKHLQPGSRKMIKDYASLLFKQAWSEAEVRSLDNFRIPLDHKPLARVFPGILANWYGRYSELQPVFDLFFLPIYNRALNVEFQFLGLLQALEALHRATIGGSYMSVTEYESTCRHLVSEIPAALTTDHRDALKSRMRYGYEYSLRKRLSELVDVITMQTMYKITNGEDPRRFLRRVVDTRNYLTHYDERLKAASMAPREMIKANHSLTLLLRFLILREIGVPVDLALDRLKDLGLLTHPIFLDLGDLP